MKIGIYRKRDFSSVLLTAVSENQTPKFIKALMPKDHFIAQHAITVSTGSSCHCLATRHDEETFKFRLLG